MVPMTRPQKCKRGLRHMNLSPRQERFFIYDPTAEMQKGIKTLEVAVAVTLLLMTMTRPQKCKRGLRLLATIFHYSAVAHDPTAEMQKGIKTVAPRNGLAGIAAYDPTAEMQKGIKTHYFL